MSVNENNIDEKRFEVAKQLEEGAISSPISEKSVGFDVNRPLTTRASTFADTIKSSKSAFQRAATWGSSTTRAVLPQTSSSKAKFKTLKLESFPLGYPRLSQFMSSDDSFMMYRSFSRLHSRLLLHKQDQLRELESDLLLLDQKDNEDEEDGQMCLQSREHADAQEPPEDGSKSRIEILEESEELLKEYASLLKQAYELQAMNRPTDRDHASVTNYFDRFAPVTETDRDFLLHKEDLVTIRAGRDHAWLDAAVEAFLRWYPTKFSKYLFCDSETLAKTDEPTIHYFSRARISFFVTLLITILILVLLVLPIWVLYWLSTHKDTGPGDFLIIAVLLICTLVFSATLSLFTKAKRHELLAASAGYCAVLVVFVGNLGDNVILTDSAGT